VFTFESAEEVEAYLRHPTHQAVAAELRSLFSGAQIVDLRVAEV
jgi:hypothetical protein